MPLSEALRLALQAIWTSKLRSFFTLLGIIVSVGFLVVVVAVIQGMNAYVKENLTGAVIGTNAFQVRRNPISVGLLDDEQVKVIAKRPLISEEDAAAVQRAIPEARAVSIQSGWPTPVSDVVFRNRTVGSVAIFGVTPPYQVVQDYQMLAGDPLSEPDVRERRPVGILGYDVADKLFDRPASAVGQRIRITGREVVVKGVIAKKGRVLGQSFDGFIMMPFSTFESFYGRRKTTVVSVKMADGGGDRAGNGSRRRGDARGASAPSRRAQRLHGGQSRCPRRFLAPAHAHSLYRHPRRGLHRDHRRRHRHHEHHAHERDRAHARDRTPQVARRTPPRHPPAVPHRSDRALDARRLQGVFGGWGLAVLVSTFTPLPARITLWSVGVALALGAGAGSFSVSSPHRAPRGSIR